MITSIQKYIPIGKRSKTCKNITLKKISFGESLRVQYLENNISILVDKVRKSMVFGKEAEKLLLSLQKEIMNSYKQVIDICTVRRFPFCKNSLWVRLKDLFSLYVEAKGYSLFTPEKNNVKPRASTATPDYSKYVQKIIATIAYAFGWTEKEILDIRYDVIFDYLKLIDGEHAKRVLDDTNSAIFANPYAGKMTKDIVKNLQKRAFGDSLNKKKVTLDEFFNFFGKN